MMEICTEWKNTNQAAEQAAARGEETRTTSEHATEVSPPTNQIGKGAGQTSTPPMTTKKGVEADIA